MKGHAKVMASLRELLKYELTAINQSFLHARMCLDWGYERIADRIRKASIKSMIHSEQLVDRILFLEGKVNLRDTYHLRIGADVHRMHSRDLLLARDTIDCANAGIAVCVENKDDTSRELIERILENEEQKIVWLESQLQIIKDAGLGLYLSQQVRD